MTGLWIAIGAGMSDYLTKPLRTPALQETLERWISSPAVVGQPAN